MSVREIIIKPLFTEKMSQLEEAQGKYAFHVDSSANKIEIKDAVEKRFDVEVANSPSLCPTIFSEIKTGINLFPL